MGGADRITDFGKGDEIVLVSIDADTETASMQDFAFVGTAGAVALRASDGGTGIQGDTNSGSQVDHEMCSKAQSSSPTTASPSQTPQSGSGTRKLS
ncbi:hypothetical protein [Inquilinus limosus]|uniref:hypothetical protein n=1 Tax=Inquilinus limosus TaxID=171674 RepID=UPI003F5CDDCA